MNHKAVGFAIGTVILGATTLGAVTTVRGVPLSDRPASSEQEIDGKVLFQKECAACHGNQGRGNGRAGRVMDPRPTDITDPDYLAAKDDAYLLEVVANGSGEMAGIADDYDEAEMKAIVAYVRKLGEKRKK
jgi:high-affinity iron transporter